MGAGHVIEQGKGRIGVFTIGRDEVHIHGLHLIGRGIGHAFRAHQRADGGVVRAALRGEGRGEHVGAVRHGGTHDVRRVAGEIRHGLQAVAVLGEAQVGNQAFGVQLGDELHAFLEFFGLVGHIDIALIVAAQGHAVPGVRIIGEGVQQVDDHIAVAAVGKADQRNFIRDAVAVGIFFLHGHQVVVVFLQRGGDFHAQRLAEGVVDQKAIGPRIRHGNRPERERVQRAIGGQARGDCRRFFRFGEVRGGFAIEVAG